MTPILFESDTDVIGETRNHFQPFQQMSGEYLCMMRVWRQHERKAEWVITGERYLKLRQQLETSSTHILQRWLRQLLFFHYWCWVEGFNLQPYGNFWEEQVNKKIINGLRSTKAMVKFSDPQQLRLEKIPPNHKILSTAMSAYSVYNKEKLRKRRSRKKDSESLKKWRRESSSS